MKEPTMRGGGSVGGKSLFESLQERQKSVYADYNDAGSFWQVYTDPQRRMMESCRYYGSGDTLDEAVRNLARNNVP